MPIYLGSRLRVELPFVDEGEDGTLTPIDLSALSPTVRLIRPDGSEVEGAALVVTVPAAGEAHWEGTVDAAGVWRAQARAGGYLSAPVAWRVVENP